MSEKKSFTQVDGVREVVDVLKKADLPRAHNRALVANVFNGEAPFTDEEATENNVDTNVNFLEGTKIALDARGQFYNGFLKPANFFTVDIDLPDSNEAMKAGKIITQKINRPMKKSLAYIETMREQFASVVLHGPGPVVWPNKFSWTPDPFAVGDVLVPDRTRLDMRNLEQFAIRREWTPYELLKMTSGDRTDPGWNQPFARELLRELTDKKYRGESAVDEINLAERPEERAELVKANSLYWASSAVPTLNCWDFFYRDCEDDDGRWQRCIILDDDARSKKGKDKFLYKPTRHLDTDWSRIIHWQFGDAASSPPRRYDTLRSLGWLLYNVLQLQNRLRCRFSDAVFSDLLWFFRVANPTDLDRIQRVDLHHLGILPEGLSILKREERYTPDFNLVNTLFQQNRQLMAESAASYVQNVDDGRQKEMTAAEVLARQNAANAIVSSMLNMAFTYQSFQYAEICRRFLNRQSRDPDVKKFWQEMKREQVPLEALDFERWTVTPERVLGAGNKTIEMLEAQQLMAIRAILDPDAQRLVTHRYILANSDDARLADKLAPLDKPLLPSESIVEGQQAAAVLLMGLDMGIRSGVNRSEYIGAMLQSLGKAVGRVQQRGEMVRDPEELQGLQNLSQHIKQNIQLFEQDTEQKELVRQFEGMLSKLDNFIRGFEQRLAKQIEQRKQEGANGQMDPETQAAIQKDVAITKQKLAAKEAAAAQRLRQREQQFASEEQRKGIELQHRMGREGVEFQTDQALKDADKAMEIRREQAAEAEAEAATE